MNTTGNNLSPACNAVKRLARERPNWLPIVEACLEEAKITKGEFAGAWVLEQAKKKGINWFPNLRLLVSYGILRHEDTTWGGRRAYYTMPDPEGVEEALQELRLNQWIINHQNLTPSWENLIK